MLQVIIDHGVPAVFDDDDLSEIPADIRHRLDNGFGPFRICYGSEHLTPPSSVRNQELGIKNELFISPV